MAYDEELAWRLRDLLADEDAHEQPMFGGLAFLVSGNMAVAASSGGGLLLRVDPRETDELLRRPGAEPFVMRERPMEGWLRVSEAGVRTKRQLASWVGIGVSRAKALPAKRPR